MVTEKQQDDIPANSDGNRPDRRRLLMILVAVTAAAVAMLIFANRTDTATEADSASDPGEMAEVRFEEHGFSIELPMNWQFFEQSRPDPQIAMVAGVPGTQNNVRVRVSPLNPPVFIDRDTPEELVAQLQAQFDDFINEDAVRELRPRQRVSVAGMQGWHYLYVFADERTGEEGVHSHFFLLGGPRLYTLVFQALPVAGYGELARTFDQIVTSFELIGEPDPESIAPEQP